MLNLIEFANSKFEPSRKNRLPTNETLPLFAKNLIEELFKLKIAELDAFTFTTFMPELSLAFRVPKFVAFKSPPTIAEFESETEELSVISNVAGVALTTLGIRVNTELNRFNCPLLWRLRSPADAFPPRFNVEFTRFREPPSSTFN